MLTHDVIQDVVNDLYEKIKKYSENQSIILDVQRGEFNISPHIKVMYRRGDNPDSFVIFFGENDIRIGLMYRIEIGGIFSISYFNATEEKILDFLKRVTEEILENE